MTEPDLIEPKRTRPVRLWVHPEGPVDAEIFLRPPGPAREGELPVAVLNHPDPFLVCRCGAAQRPQIRFYNKHSLVRVEYVDASEESAHAEVTLEGEFQLMDGSVFTGVIRENLPKQRRRLLDFMNQYPARFLRLFPRGGGVSLINRAYVMRVVPLNG